MPGDDRGQAAVDPFLPALIAVVLAVGSVIAYDAITARYGALAASIVGVVAILVLAGVASAVDPDGRAFRGERE